MQEHIFYFLWAAICAWIFTKILIWTNDQIGLSVMPGFVWAVDLVHGWGLSIKKMVFFALLVLFLLTGIHKLLGNWLGVLIGWVILIIVVIIVCVVGWHFLTWIVSTL